MVSWRDYLDHRFDIANNSGPRADTIGVVVHSTRGGLAVGDEYNAVINYFTSPTARANAHLLIGQDGRMTQFMDFGLIAWHALNPANLHYIGVEMEQPKYDTPYTGIQYAVLASWIREMSQTYGFPLDRQHIIGHDEEPNGIAQGKTDPGPMFNWGYEVELWNPIVCNGDTLCADGSCPPCSTAAINWRLYLGLGLLAAGGIYYARERRWL